jgi:hypothetical protein
MSDVKNLPGNALFAVLETAYSMQFCANYHEKRVRVSFSAARAREVNCGRAFVWNVSAQTKAEKYLMCQQSHADRALERAREKMTGE